MSERAFEPSAAFMAWLNSLPPPVSKSKDAAAARNADSVARVVAKRVTSIDGGRVHRCK